MNYCMGKNNTRKNFRKVNLKVIKWLNIFLGKTELNWNLFGEKKDELKKNFRRIDKYLKEEFEDKDDKILLGKHLIIMYNIGKYLDNKKKEIEIK